MANDTCELPLHGSVGAFPDTLPSPSLHDARAKPSPGEWRRIDHLANTSTGFGGSLFRSRATGERVLSFHSSGGSYGRDIAAINRLEIDECGWALGQISDMEGWYQSLLKSQLIPENACFSINSFSLCRHLAAAFNQLRQEDGTAHRIVATYTLEGVDAEIPPRPNTLTKALRIFREIREHGAAQAFYSVQGAALYRSAKHQMEGGATLDLLYRLLDRVPACSEEMAAVDLTLLQQALQRTYDIASQHQAVWSDMAALELDYQLGVLIAARKTRACPPTAHAAPARAEALAALAREPADVRSLVPMIDSMAVRGLLEKLDPGLDDARWAALIAVSEKLAERDALQQIVNALASMFGVGPPPPYAAPRGNFWFEPDVPDAHAGHKSLHQRLGELASSEDFKRLAGKLRIEPSSAARTSSTGADLAAFIAWLDRSPLVFRAVDPGASRLLSHVLQKQRPAAYGAWLAKQADGDLAKLFAA